LKTKEISRDDWLDLRKKGIGGSDISAIMGVNPWKTPYQLYLDKTGQAHKTEMNEKMYWGTVMEDVVAAEFAKRTGVKVRRKNRILQHKEHSWMLANVDRILAGTKEGLECKTASEYAKADWEADEVPISYLMQCQWYMAVTGYKAWWIAALVGGNTFIFKKIERDEILIDEMIDKAKTFWHNHVLKGIAPEVRAGDAQAIKDFYPKAEEGTVELGETANGLLKNLEYYKRHMDDLEAAKEADETKLKQLLGTAEQGRTEEYTVSWKNVSSTRFDSAAFKKDNKALYEQYAKESTSRRFQFKKI